MRPEHRFSKAIQKELESIGWLVFSIETGPTMRGIPDLYAAKKKATGWVELKIVTPHQEREPRTPIQIKRQAEMRGQGVKVLNAHDIRDSRDNNCGYKLYIGLEPILYPTLHDLAKAIAAFLENN